MAAIKAAPSNANSPDRAQTSKKSFFQLFSSRWSTIAWSFLAIAASRE